MDPEKETKISRLKKTAWMTTLSLALVGTSVGVPSAAIFDFAFGDDVDSDDDDLSDKLELELLKTLSNNKNSDGSGKDDGLDLLPLGTGTSLDLIVTVTKLDSKDKCDVWGGGTWDPFISTGFVNIQTLQGTPSAVFTKTGYTEGNHGHDKGAIQPEHAIQAKIAIPQDYTVYVVPSVDSFPFLHLVFGLADHDVNLDDEVRLTGSSATIDDATKLLIGGPVDGTKLSVTYEGGGSSCDGLIVVAVDSPITVANLVAAILKRAHPGQLITADMVLQRMPGSERCSPGIDFVGAEETCFATVDIADDPLLDATSNSGTDVDAAKDADEYAETDSVEHTAWHYLGAPLDEVAGTPLNVLLGSAPGAWEPSAAHAESAAPAQDAARLLLLDADGNVIDARELGFDLEPVVTRDGLTSIPSLNVPLGAEAAKLVLEVSSERSGRSFEREWAISSPAGSETQHVYIELGQPGRAPTRLFSTWETSAADGDFWSAMHERVQRHA